MNEDEYLIPKRGGFRNLRSFLLSRVCFDVTVRFVDLYVPKGSRTCDQMIQAARSGVQNIAEGSVASATSKETELKLTNVARASLEELSLDYEDFLRQGHFPVWDVEHPFRVEFIRRKVACNRDFHSFVDWALGQQQKAEKSAIVANAALLLLNVAKYLLSRQIERLSEDFTQNGGFRERMSQFRRMNRENNHDRGGK